MTMRSLGSAADRSRISATASPSPISNFSGTPAPASDSANRFIAASSASRSSGVGTVTGSIGVAGAYAVAGTSGHTLNTVIVESYHFAIATAWSSARRE